MVETKGCTQTRTEGEMRAYTAHAAGRIGRSGRKGRGWPRDGMLLGQMEKGADGDRTVALSQTGGVLAVSLLPVILGREGGNLMEERAASSSREVGEATPDDEGAAAEDALFSDLSQSEGLKFVG